jgi:hypothetical protein
MHIGQRDVLLKKHMLLQLNFDSLGDTKVAYHLWDETLGKMGSCEIAICSMKNIMSVCSPSNEIKEVTYYSDTSGGQNRNQYVVTSFLCTLSRIPSLKKLNHKFLQSPHSNMEYDSVHSTIETANRKTSVYVPSQWCRLASLARRSNHLKYYHVLNWKAFVNKHCSNLQRSTAGEKINWLNVHLIQVRQSTPKSLFVNYSFNEASFIEIDIQAKSTRQGTKMGNWPEQLEKCYAKKILISIQKKTDLMQLCTKGIIPEEFNHFFKALQVDKQVKDKFPEPALDEDSTDTNTE